MLLYPLLELTARSLASRCHSSGEDASQWGSGSFPFLPAEVPFMLQAFIFIHTPISEMFIYFNSHFHAHSHMLKTYCC
eukprot:1149535-Pelagomonas_calceolata.AAC.3